MLYRALSDVCEDFRLRVFCMDSQTRAILTALELPKLETIPIELVEAYDPDLRAVKTRRSSVEYCWTATPSMMLYAFEADAHLDALSYIDADTMCFTDPRQLLDELEGASVLLVPNVGLPGDGLGQYLGGFISFRSDAAGIEALRFWRERCLEWCFDRVEPGRYGSVRHLDDWPQRFPGVRVLRHPGGAVGPWNVATFSLERRSGALLVRGEPLVLDHCVAHWIYRGWLTALPRAGVLSSYYHRTPGRNGVVWSSAFFVPEREHALLEAPYMELVGKAIADVRAIDPRFGAGFVTLTARAFGYSVLRRALPGSIRGALREAFLSGRPKHRGPPGSPC